MCLPLPGPQSVSDVTSLPLPGPWCWLAVTSPPLQGPWSRLAATYGSLLGTCWGRPRCPDTSLGTGWGWPHGTLLPGDLGWVRHDVLCPPGTLVRVSYVFPFSLGPAIGVRHNVLSPPGILVTVGCDIPTLWGSRLVLDAMSLHLREPWKGSAVTSQTHQRPLSGSAATSHPLPGPQSELQ